MSHYHDCRMCYVARFCVVVCRSISGSSFFNVIYGNGAVPRLTDVESTGRAAENKDDNVSPVHTLLRLSSHCTPTSGLHRHSWDVR